MTMESTQLRNIVEGALLAAGQPLNLNRLKALFEEGEEPETEALKSALEVIAADCEGRGFELKEVGSGWRFQVRTEVAPWINRLWEEKPQKYSRALLETLALVAYRQPITRGDIEEIRGVAVSSHIIKTLTEREWIKVVGHRDVPGRPSLYATTRQFLDYFNLKSLDELPSLGEIRDLNDINAALDLDTEAEGNSDDDTNDDSATQASPEENVDDNAAESHDQNDGAEHTAEAEAGSDDLDETQAQAEPVNNGAEPSTSDEVEHAEAAEDEATEEDADESAPSETAQDPDGEQDPEDASPETEYYEGSLFERDETNDTDAEPRQNPEADQSSL